MVDDEAAAAPHLTIAVVSSQCLVWHGLQKVLGGIETFRIDVQPYRTVTPELLLANRRPNLFIVDLEPGQDTIRIIKHLRESISSCKIVLLSGLEDKGRLLEAFACGIDGVILKIQPPEVILAVIEAIYAPMPSRADIHWDRMEERGLTSSFPKEVKPEPQPMTWPEALTKREREIIRLVEEGLSNKDIADRLAISDSTVRHHMTNISIRLAYLTDKSCLSMPGMSVLRHDECDEGKS